MLGSPTAPLAPDAAPLDCPHCLGLANEPGRRLRATSEGLDGECTRCHGSGHVTCDDCDEHPSEAPAVGCDPTDADIKLCASCLAKPCSWCGVALSAGVEAHEQCFPDVPEWDGVGPDDPRAIKGDYLRDQQRDAHVGGR